MPAKPALRIGTRASALALAQATETRSRLMAAHAMPAEAFEIVVMSTAGDRIQDRPLAEVGGKGLFTAEIEATLLDGRIDIAVHSSKDMPTLLPLGLKLAAFLPRADPRDAFIGRTATSIAALPPGAVIGTSSLRREALIRRLRPDLQLVSLRGNVQTRLRKLAEGRCDGTILALAGLERLGLAHIATELLPLGLFPPAPGQGAICIESRDGDARTAALLTPIHHRPTGQALACERAFLQALDGSCRTPIAGHAVVDGDRLAFRGLYFAAGDNQGGEIVVAGPATDAALLGRDAGNALRAALAAKPDQAAGFMRQTVQLSADAIVTQIR